MNITIEKYQSSIDQFGDFSRFWVTLKDQQGKSKVINVDCSETVRDVWKIDDREELFRALFPLLKNKIKELMNKRIRSVNQLPDIKFSNYNIPKYPPNESFSLPDTFSLSDAKINKHSQEKLIEDDNPFILEPNFYGIGVKLKKFFPWIKKKYKHITKQSSELPSKTPEKEKNTNHSETQSQGSAELDKTEERILLYLYQNERTEVDTEELRSYFSEIGDTAIDSYIEELKIKKYLKKSRKFSFLWLDHKGKKYLIENKLINT